MTLNITSETGRLREVILGLPYSNGPAPELDKTIDAKSYESVKSGCYPAEADIVREMDAFKAVLEKYGVVVHRPDLVPDTNQVFSRDVGFVIDDRIVVSNIIPARQSEIDAYGRIYENIRYTNIYNLPEAVHIEGGDVILYKDYIMVGQYNFQDYPQVRSARTNRLAIDYLKMLFPERIVLPLNLRKSDTDPYEGILHLDCAFMPVGKNKAIIYKDGFMNPRDAEHLVHLFGDENVFLLNKEEMYWMTANVLSISPEVVVVEENFTRLAEWLEANGITAERVPYRNISRMGGLLRCSTLPLRRD